MNKNEVKTYLLKKNTFQNISITKDAIEQILFLINVNSDNIGIRLSIKKSGCAGFRYSMKLLKASELKKEKDEKEVSFFYQNILIYIYSKDIPFLEGIRIDFVKNNINKIFKFYNTKLEKFCGCGESFSIN
ncbi:iron-sulfur cluster assembly accessory protein [Buchnera aphidicola]|uniref:iron-sulfur cluster assembly accessory protein n=1 Tax=Buchnera aphidicola TaxID=9 RepID=UPI000189C596|nr:iron-sulfur cluster assembly accessory protein [Buchnera aphidicola]ADP66517.1 integral membrane protein of SoxR-reducing complex [Buchnera aphidicola str. TLW03 (Acyrthosiphon pisum)]ADP67665.1 integral membrane protein of SoxR-reducing complex [Buchnera aphidicola str. JF98 (Acyrthosiphon pisum)]ACL29942.1 integral membrane protein of SoxR-reducing complex [Buchnera aphidicola str. Tuc7 (Acyrthosiphon pisum)]ADP65948.1 integral membrane protein of SoxR-reducing complex [Buchnera aphidicola